MEVGTGVEGRCGDGDRWGGAAMEVSMGWEQNRPGAHSPGRSEAGHHSQPSGERGKLSVLENVQGSSAGCHLSQALVRQTG